MSEQPPQDPFGQQPPPEGEQPPSWGQQPGWGQQPPPPPFPPAGPGGYGAGGYGPPPFSATDAIGYGWRKFTQNAGPFIAIAVLTFVAFFSLSLVGSIASSGGDFLSGDSDDMASFGLAGGFSLLGSLFNLLAQAVYTLIAAAMVRGALDVVEGSPVSFGAMWERWDKLQVLLAALVISVVSTIGFILCILPGIVVVFLTWFATWFIVGGGRSAIDGIMDSVKFTSSHVGELIVLTLLSFAVIILGVLACCVGLVVAIPVVTIASGYAFRVLHGLPAAP